MPRNVFSCYENHPMFGEIHSFRTIFIRTNCFIFKKTILMMLFNNDSLYDTSNMEISIPRSIRFWLLLLADIPSVICTIFILFHMFTDRVLRRALQNHVIAALLISGMAIQLIDIPFYLTFIRFNHIWPQTQTACFIWWYADVGICFTSVVILAWASIERHILVFHDNWVSTRKKRFLIHYLSLFTVIGYPLCFYLLALLLYPCNHSTIDYSLPWCHYSPCYYNNSWLHLWDIVMNRLLPSVFITTCNIGLLCRVLWYKHYRFRRPIVWRKHRKMIIQLVSVAAVYLLFGFPLFIVQICTTSNVQLNPQIHFYLYFFSFLTILAVPFVCLASLPNRITRNTWNKLVRCVH
jgi:hypothetical protein